jgi:hypothetical protein
MKISAYHKSIGNRVEFATMFDKYTKIFTSKIFDFTENNSELNEIFLNFSKLIAFSN